MDERWGAQFVETRLCKQAEVSAYEERSRNRPLGELMQLETFIALCVKLSGLWKRGHRNFHNISVEQNELCLPNLPQAFDGFRILQISDTHADISPPLIDAILHAAENLTYDLCIHTGDYRNLDAGDIAHSMELTTRLIKGLRQPLYGILGNHDWLEMVAPLEAAGMTMLVNESAILQKGDSVLYLCGVDDNGRYGTHDLIQLRQQIGDRSPALLLAHSPAIYQEAERLGFLAQFSGHTHGGQICLPGGHLVLGKCQCPRNFLSGRWHFQTLQGYTSRGAGGCAVPVRFNCPPEITLHTLRKARTG